MLSRQIATARPLRAVIPIARRTALLQHRCASSAPPSNEPPYPRLTELEDPNMNGGYINPPPVKRQFRDPHGDWWDKQERRNYGEPVHEDNDILGMFSPHEYTHVKPGKGALQLLTFVGAVFGLCAVISIYYPDKQSAPREFEGGLERELGGPKALRARAPGDKLE
ncbi:nadh:ubiquinone oxidoreductase subunit [Phlyctema vagabunda]|uniref:Nadh:ubiquinone oxidoreductase subunit n=1 Tax=Phlyctema vagabunda TaxID=108571 RepID=A0ABR4PK66_9HELO